MPEEPHLAESEKKEEITFGELARGVMQTARELGPVVSAAAIACMTLPIVGQVFLYTNLGRFRLWLDGFGATAAAVYAALFAVTTGSAVMPTFALSGVAGYLFGIQTGSVIAMCGVVVGAAIGYLWAILLARHQVMDVLGRHPKARVIRDALVERGYFVETGVVSLIRLPPNSPFALTNLTLGAARVKPLVYLSGTLVGIAPRTIAAVIIGAGLAEAGKELSGENLKGDSKMLIIGGIVITLIVVVILYQLFSRWANRALERWAAQNAE